MRKPATVAGVGGERKTEGEGLGGGTGLGGVAGGVGRGQQSICLSGVGRNGEISGFRLSL